MRKCNGLDFEPKEHFVRCAVAQAFTGLVVELNALLSMMAFGYLQHRRMASALQAKKNGRSMPRVTHRNRHCRRYAGSSSP